MENKGNAATAAKADSATGTTEQAAPAVDRFANLPSVKLEGTTVVDMSGMETAAPRKYEKVATAAVAARTPIKAGWKYARAILVPGTNKKEHRPTSVFGTIQAIVNKAGRQGISSYDLATQLRQQQIDNKRSHYASGKLPPVGWAEGYIDSAVTQNLVGVHGSRQADSIFAAPAPATDDKKAANA